MPYAPYAVNHSGMILAGGISSAGNSIVNRIDQHTAEMKRLKAFRAMAVDGLGMDPEQVDQMDADTLQGKLEAVAIRSQRERESAALQDQQYQQMQRHAGAQFQAGLNTGQPVTPQAMLSAAQQAGYQLPPNVLTQMMRENDAVNWDQIMPHPFEVDGVKGVVGKSGQFQFLPQTTPESMQAIPVMDTDGNIVGMRVPTGKGGSAPLPKNNPKTLPDSYNSRLSLLQDELKTAQSTAAKTDDELKKLKLSGTRDYYQKAAQAALKAIGDHVSRFQEQGYADDKFWAAEKQRLGLSREGSQGGEGKATGRVTVSKDGKQFTVPAAQLEEARKQGYTEVK